MMRDKCLYIDTSNGRVSDEQMQLCGIGMGWDGIGWVGIGWSGVELGGCRVMNRDFFCIPLAVDLLCMCVSACGKPH